MKPCSIYKLWPLLVLAVIITGCRTSRFMQDDMYFTTIDAKREVREYEVNKAEIIRRQYLMSNPQSPAVTKDSSIFNMDNYYDYSYSSRIRRFQHDNTWAYYDPYYTNYYWFNSSKTAYFGNSVYSSYAWWGPNLGTNYSSEHWTINSRVATNKKWTNPWSNTAASWKNPYAPFYYNGWNSAITKQNLWSNDLTQTNLYYNSCDNNCYWGWWKKGKIPGGTRNNFAALMQRNGVSKDVIQRPDINYTQIREDYNKQMEANLARENDSINSYHIASTNNPNENNTVRTSKSDVKETNPNTSNTSKRWNNYKADVKITDKKDDKDNKWSRSGVFSEGSRDNNYQFKGSINNKDKGKEKDPRKK